MPHCRPALASFGTIMQDAGLIQGAVLLSPTNADRLDIVGGTVNGQVTGGATAAIDLAGGSLVLDTAFKDNIGAFSFTESGGSVADLAVSGSDVDSFTTSFGARASTRIDAGANGVLVPEAHAIWQREYLDDRAKVGAAFAVAPGSNFTVVSNRFGANTGLVGIGITQEASADVKIFVNYDAQIQNSFASHTISAGLRVRF
jgi:hypothetical protein